MTDDELLTRTRVYVQKLMSGDGSGHDWWHIYRVEQMALHLADQEAGADKLVVQLGALLHDIADWKFHDGDFEAGPRKTREFLTEQGADPKLIEQVEYIVRHVSFRGGTNTHVMQSIEGKIVQDADRLDAMGAIGVARTFAFGGSMNRDMYDPNNKPREYTSFEEYKKHHISGNTTVNHFYEKLLLLKDRLNTESARKVAQKRHEFMEQFLEEFYAEWEGER
jgi:uncharacterized protein